MPLPREGKTLGQKTENAESDKKKPTAQPTPVQKSYLNNDKINIGRAKGLYDTAPLREKVLKWQQLGAADTAKTPVPTTNAGTTLRKPKSDLGLQRSSASGLGNEEVKAKSELYMKEQDDIEDASNDDLPVGDGLQERTPKKRIVSDEHWLATRLVTKPSGETPKKQANPPGAKVEHGLYIRPGSKRPDAWVRRKTKVDGPAKVAVEKRATDPPITVKRRRSKSQPAYVMRRAQFEAVDELVENDDSNGIEAAERHASVHPIVQEIDAMLAEKQEPLIADASIEETPKKPKATEKRPSPRRAFSGKTPLEQRKILQKALYPFGGLKPPPEPIPSPMEDEGEDRKEEPRLPIPPKPGRIEAWIHATADPFTEDIWESGVPRSNHPGPSIDRQDITIRRRRMRRAKPKSEEQSSLSHGSDDRTDTVSDDSRSGSPIKRRPAPLSKTTLTDDSYDESSQMSPQSPSLRRTGAQRHPKSPRQKDLTGTFEPKDGLSPLDESRASTSTTSRSREDESYFSKPLKRSAATKHRSRNAFGRQPLSTIASVETFGTRGIDEELSHETSDTKRKIASHADLISVLSMQEGDSKSLVSAHSIRTTRKKIGAASIDQIMDELVTDETKYLRELCTAVDGVIPVLLSCVITQSNSSTTAGLVGSIGNKDYAMTNIVNIGIALERLKSAHRRIPTSSAEAFLLWASSSHRVYSDYIKAWRLGFKHLVVSLAPGDSQEGATGSLSIQHNKTAKSKDNLVAARIEGEKVDVSFILKRPLIRLRYLVKILKAIESSTRSEQAKSLVRQYEELVVDAHRKQDEERARLEDEAAASLDATRAREVLTLIPLTGVKIDQTRCVRARDSFDLTLEHSSGQRLDCRVELILRDDGFGKKTGGDLLMCEVEDGSKWLLFPPLSRNLLSARRGDSERELVIMIRGYDNIGMQWHELFSLTSDDADVQKEWIQMLGSHPIPPEIPQHTDFADEHVSARSFKSRARSTAIGMNGEILNASEISVPLGERIEKSPRRRNDRDSERPRARPYSLPTTPARDYERTERASRVPRPRYASRSPSPAGSHRSRSSDGYTVWFPESETGNLRTGRKEGDLPSEHQDDLYGDYRRGTPMTSKSHKTDNIYELRPEKQRSPQSASRRSPIDLRGVSTPHLSSRTPPSGTQRRSSSPLKHEYEPSTSSDATSQRGDIVSDDDYSVTSESSVEGFSDPIPPLKGLKRVSDAASIRSFEPTTLGPSESASQAPYRTVPHQENEELKTVATLYTWSEKGIWNLIYPNECTVVVSPGLIEAFNMSSSHAKERDSSSDKERPLVALELTPLVPLRRGTALDISIRSPPTSNSKLRPGNNIMFRSRSSAECEALYGLINQARINNPTFMALQNARGPFGGATSNWASYMDKQASERGKGSWWKIGSRSSYRAESARRTTSVAGETESSVATMSSAMSALKRFTSGSRMFNVGKSSLFSRGGASRSTFSSSTGSSGPQPLGFDPSKGTPTGMSQTKIRIYERETASKWRDMGSARLSIFHPPLPPGAEPVPGALSTEKRILIQGKTHGETVLDVTLGEAAFERVARTGLALSVWEQHVGLNGDLGQVGKTGGVLSARVKVYMIQMKSEAEAAYAFSLVGRLRY